MLSPSDLTPFLAPIAGGALIGGGAALLLLGAGRVAGISGIVAGLATRQVADERAWRALFIAGLLVAGVVAKLFTPEAFGPITTPLPVLAVAGLLVGLGARLGSGCTSGHGVCGVSRASKRSLTATGVFMVVAVATVFLVQRGAS